MTAAVRVRIYCDPAARAAEGPLAAGVLRRLRRERTALVTVVTAGEGPGFLRPVLGRAAEPGVPARLIIEWIDVPERVDAVWPELEPLLRETVVTRETVDLLVSPSAAPPALRLPGDLRVCDVMSADTLTVEASAPAESVLVLMRDADLDFVPVVDGDRLVGVVTAADLLPAAPGELAARDLMTADVVTAPPWMRLPDAARLMLERSVRRIPVIEHDRLLGVLTKVDLLRAVTATGAPHDQVHRLPGAPRTVGEIAVTDVPTVTPAAPLTEVLDAVAATAGGYAVVVDGAGVVRGIVDEGEVLRRIEHATGGRGLGRVVHRLAQRRDEAGEIAAITAADVMGPPAPVPPDLPIDEAAARMVEARLLTVVDGVGRLIGVVDRWEALRSVLPAPAG